MPLDNLSHSGDEVISVLFDRKNENPMVMGVAE